jgi:hypothetical protein
LVFTFTLCLTLSVSTDPHEKSAFQRDYFQKPESTEQKQPTVKVKTKNLHPKQTLHQPIAHIG